MTRFLAFALNRLPLGLAAACLFVGVTINLASVVGRYFFAHALFWAEEAMVYLFIWSVFLAAVAVVHDGMALTMDLWTASLGPRLRRVAEAATALLTIGICLYVASLSFQLVQVLYRNGQRSLALEIPMVVPQAALLIGFALIACAAATRFFATGADRGETNEESAT